MWVCLGAELLFFFFSKRCNRLSYTLENKDRGSKYDLSGILQALHSGEVDKREQKQWEFTLK